ncbi:MAG: hypothetical protein GWP05_05050 [Anaerolineaceae bacterium]|nr:hypothetical protein [Anaerolineaceae bacterium]
MTEHQPRGVPERLQTVIDRAGSLRRRKHLRYDRGHIFDVQATGVCPANCGRVRMVVEKFVGGGFAGQVYRVRLEEARFDGGPPPGLEVGGRYAVKIIIPPSGFALAFRNTVYRLAYQGPFSAQVHPAAARSGVLWQKLIRRAGQVEFGRPDAICDTYATFFEPVLGSWAEINEWVDGRNWKFELDEHYFERHEADPADEAPDFSAGGAGEYVAKKWFMARFVRLLHRMGAPELARQYEWWTAKSQPNVLKRIDSGDGPADGLCAIDFRAGLALLPFLPMSPADVKLILAGLRRGRLVQFDRGDLARLEAFIDRHADRFEDLRPALEELKRVDPAYRASLPDLTHHGLRPLWDGRLRRSIADGFIHGWRTGHLCDQRHEPVLRSSRIKFFAFFLLGLIPLLGRLVRKLWAVDQFRRHLGSMLTSWSYLGNALHARQAEILEDWHRSGRRSDEAIVRLATSAWRFWPQRCTLALLPPTWHRFLAEWPFAWRVVVRTIGGLILFIKDADFRQKWLETIIDQAHSEGELTDDEYADLRPKAGDPYIRTYLLCVIGHMLSVPVTQIVAAIVAARYTARTGDYLGGGGILVLFQVIPISPGSVFRGLFVVAVMIVKRNFRDFRIAAAVSFWKYIGYLGFPIQMVTRYPTLARMLAGRWAGGAVQFIPVFGEHGALLEHAVLDSCFNEPVSIRRRLADGKETLLRLVGKVLLAIQWLALTAVSGIMLWRLRPPPEETTGLALDDLQPIFVVNGLGLLALLLWIALAPRLARVRRWWWPLVAVSLLPTAVAVAVHFDTIRAAL